MWNPTETPYRVCWTSPAGYPVNYKNRIQTFATEAEARAAVDGPMMRGETVVSIDLAINPETWTRNGRWQFIDKRRRAPKVSR